MENCVDIVKTYCTFFDDPDAKLAFFINDVQHRALNSICRGAATYLKNSKIIFDMSVLCTARNSFLYNTLNQIMDKMVPAGIPQYLLKFHEANLYDYFIPEIKNSPNILKIEDLFHGFAIWLAACGLSILACLMEISWPQRRQIWSKFKEFLKTL